MLCEANGACVKRIHWMLLVCLAGLLIGLGQPAKDAPDTAFNEMDAPVCIAHPNLPRLSLKAPALSASANSRQTPQSSPARNGNPLARRWWGVRRTGSHDLQKLLCTFLI
jgi:hypothetical protein